MTVLTGWRRLCLLTTVFVVGAMVVAALFHNEFRGQNWDPMQTRVNVQRTLHFGGTFYENALVNKGPLEPMVYRIATAITSPDGFWYAISAIVIVISAVLGWAASITARAVGGHRLLGTAIGIGVFFHFTLGRADYAGALYSRNMIIGLYAGAWLVALSPRWWSARRAPWAAALVGTLLGLGVQTLFVSTIAAIGVGVVAWSSVSARGRTDLDGAGLDGTQFDGTGLDGTGLDRAEFDGAEFDVSVRRSRRILIGVPIAVVVSAPLYYAIRGRLEEFWSGYWTYNQYQNIATGRSLANQLVYGRDVILRYYRTWPVSLVIVVAFFALTAALWASMGRRERRIHLALSIWFVGAWTELVAGQRYSSHYYSILALPTALMTAAVVGHVYRMVHREHGDFRSVAAWPLAASLLAIAAGGGQHVTLGLQAASSYSSVAQNADRRRDLEPGKQRTVRAVMDLASTQGDPLLAWTEFPWVYLNYQRVAATRWIWKSFMLGQIYLGRSSPEYVLPKTWTWFADDMAAARPAVFLEEVALPVAAGTPFDVYVTRNFESVYTNTDNIVHLRNDVAEAILRGDRGAMISPKTPIGSTTAWQVGRGRASLSADAPASLVDVLGLSDSRCVRISGTYAAVADAAGTFISFRFDRADGSVPNVRLNIVGNQIFSGSDTAIFDATYLPDAVIDPNTDPNTDPATDPATETTTDPTTDPDGADVSPAEALSSPAHDFAIVVGDRSAALVVDGTIHAAVRLDTQDRLSLEVREGGITLTDLRSGDAPLSGGCGG
ncbi:MAG: hypothetical protein ABIW84_04830 [Ilumatobacteraceae bacterium]